MWFVGTWIEARNFPIVPKTEGSHRGLKGASQPLQDDQTELVEFESQRSTHFGGGRGNEGHEPQPQLAEPASRLTLKLLPQK